MLPGDGTSSVSPSTRSSSCSPWLTDTGLCHQLHVSVQQAVSEGPGGLGIGGGTYSQARLGQVTEKSHVSLGSASGAQEGERPSLPTALPPNQELLPQVTGDTDEGSPLSGGERWRQTPHSPRPRPVSTVWLWPGHLTSLSHGSLSVDGDDFLGTDRGQQAPCLAQHCCSPALRPRLALRLSNPVLSFPRCSGASRPGCCPSRPAPGSFPTSPSPPRQENHEVWTGAPTGPLNSHSRSQNLGGRAPHSVFLLERVKESTSFKGPSHSSHRHGESSTKITAANAPRFPSQPPSTPFSRRRLQLFLPERQAAPKFRCAARHHHTTYRSQQAVL